MCADVAGDVNDAARTHRPYRPQARPAGARYSAQGLAPQPFWSSTRSPLPTALRVAAPCAR